MLDFDDLRAFRAWQSRNRRALYVCGGTFAFALLVANLIQIVKGWK
ncbi:hypothetical protein [Cupriavidus sp. D384]|nr:hypothetical protein [Cupriavidus sp. D384]